jgi:hypothetical protein
MSAQLQTVASGRRRLAGLLVLPLLVVLAGCSTAAAPAAPGPGSIDTPSRPASGALGAPGQGPGAVTVGSAPSGAPDANPSGIVTSGGGVASSGVGVVSPGVVGSAPSIAYPYPFYAGTPGVAPDHTIVVTGTGRADVNADLSDQASAQRSAIGAAIADARAQADVVARAAGVTTTGVLSVTVSSGGAYAVPMAAGAAGATPGVVQGGAPNIAPVPVPGPIGPTYQQLFVSVTVAYRIS